MCGAARMPPVARARAHAALVLTGRTRGTAGPQTLKRFVAVFNEQADIMVQQVSKLVPGNAEFDIFERISLAALVGCAVLRHGFPQKN